MKLSLDWSAYKDAGMGDAYADIPRQGGDYAKAIAACINSGQCETDSKQLMCPSFKFTGDAELSTGGRVRKLKAALSADDWEEALQDPQLARALELCVSCKGCKRECDNNVDMALIKVEYLAWRARREGHSLRSRLFANVPLLLHRLPGLRHLIRWRNSSATLRNFTQRWLGISAAMPLPVPVARPPSDIDLLSSVYRRLSDEVAADKPELVLLVDTFSRYFEPKIIEAAMAVLDSAGYRYTFANTELLGIDPGRPLCCGRTYLAQGMVEQARVEAQRLVEVLSPHVALGSLVVGFEASCVIGLRDDALALGLGEPMRSIANSTLLFEEFIGREIMAGRFVLPAREPDAAITPVSKPETLIHGHCHQKAVGAMKAVRRVMKLFPDSQYSMIESGCCGMAGTFSLETEHHAIGHDMAARDLLPALEEKPMARVIGNGFSCRQQMRAHGDPRPQHLAQWLRTEMGL